jgi:hypothetical protein
MNQHESMNIKPMHQAQARRTFWEIFAPTPGEARLAANNSLIEPLAVALASPCWWIFASKQTF